MDRRTFLSKSACLFLGSLFGLNGFSKALASSQHNGKPFFIPRIALIIDDIGANSSRARQFLELGVPITFSILPWLANSRDLAIEIHDEGHEIMLHQPMEPHNAHIDPGPGALYMGYGSEKIIKIMDENISSLPFVAGVNNHMGSRFTEAHREMHEALKVVKTNGFFFIDSLTTNHSTAYKTAGRLGIATACRNIFLDNIPNESAILHQLHRLRKHAWKYGRAIGIGHPYPETARALRQFLSGFKGDEGSLVYASRVL